MTLCSSPVSHTALPTIVRLLAIALEALPKLTWQRIHHHRRHTARQAQTRIHLDHHERRVGRIDKGEVTRREEALDGEWDFEGDVEEEGGRAVPKRGRNRASSGSEARRTSGEANV